MAKAKREKIVLLMDLQLVVDGAIAEGVTTKKQVKILASDMVAFVTKWTECLVTVTRKYDEVAGRWCLLLAVTTKHYYPQYVVAELRKIDG